MGIEPTLSAWKAEVLPLNYARSSRSRARSPSPGLRHAEWRSRERSRRREGVVGRGGFEPPKVRTTRFTVWPIWPLWNLPGERAPQHELHRRQRVLHRRRGRRFAPEPSNPNRCPHRRVRRPRPLAGRAGFRLGRRRTATGELSTEDEALPAPRLAGRTAGRGRDRPEVRGTGDRFGRQFRRTPERRGPATLWRQHRRAPAIAGARTLGAGASLIHGCAVRTQPHRAAAPESSNWVSCFQGTARPGAGEPSAPRGRAPTATSTLSMRDADVRRGRRSSGRALPHSARASDRSPARGARRSVASRISREQTRVERAPPAGEGPAAWSQRWDSNPQPPDYKSGALPIELRWLGALRRRRGPGLEPGLATGVPPGDAGSGG